MVPGAAPPPGTGKCRRAAMLRICPGGKFRDSEMLRISPAGAVSAEKTARTQ